MKARITFFLFFLLIVATAPAWARVSLGILEGETTVIAGERQARLLGEYLENRLGDEVRIRLFRDAETLHQWANRFREVDFAVLPFAYVQSQRAGEFQTVADAQPRESSQLAPDMIVGRQGLSRAQVEQARQVLASMENDAAGRQVLQALGLRRFLAPDSGLARSSTPNIGKATPPAPRPQQPAPAPQGARKPAPAAAQAIDQSAPRKIQEPDAPAATSPAKKPSRAPETAPAPRPAVAKNESLPRPSPAPPADVAASEPAPVAEPVPPPAGDAKPEDKPRIWTGEPPREAIPPTADQKTPAAQPAPVEKAAPPPAPVKDVESLDSIPLGRKIIDLLIVLIAVGATVYFFRRRRAAQRATALKPEPDRRDEDDYIHITDSSLGAEPSFLFDSDEHVRSARKSSRAVQKSPPRPPAQTPAPISSPAPELAATASAASAAGSATPATTELKGELDLFQVSSLLQMIASYPRPATLVIRSPHDEKRIHFRLGKVASAVSINRANRAQAGFLMNKLGYLLIRMGMITAQDRDRALVACEENPRLRIGEVLVRNGALSHDSLKRALRTQAEGVIFSLFLFPSGSFELIHENLDIPPADDLGLRVQSLLEEAASHEEEWSGLRETIPSLDTVLEFAEEGEDKLAKARMTAHQQLVLSLIDGRRTLKDICREATMLDFEVYKFLYMMVRARILKPAHPL